ncbi:TPA: tetratricopeptide repeat protein [Citrobacter freundii]
MEERIFKIIEIILTYASWPILVGILCFIFRSQIASLLEKILASKNLKLSTPVGNFEGEFEESIKIQDEVKSIEPESIETNDNPSNWWYLDVTNALNENDEGKAKQIFDDFIQLNKNTIDYNSEHSFFLFKLYEHNQSESVLKEIQKTIEASNIYEDKRSYINSYIMCLDYTEQYKRAIDFLVKEIERISDHNAKVYLTIRLSKLYVSDLDLLSAKKTILHAISYASNNKNEDLNNQLYSCYVQLAAIENKNGNKVHEALCLDKALEYDPTNKDTLFSSAYASIDSTLDAIQISNYKQLLNLEPEHGAALNNLGVTAENLSLKGISTNLWSSSSKTGFSLAMVNLGFTLLECGYLKAAEEMANEALKVEKPHENVHQLLTRINKEKASEEKKWSEAIAYSKKLQKDLRLYVYYYYNEQSLIPNTDSWIDENGKDVKLTVIGSLYKFEWIDESFEINYTASNIHGTVSGFYSKKIKEESRPSTLLGLNQKQQQTTQCYGYFDDKNSHMVVFSPKINDETYIILKPKR